jgi:hypothetical protein
MERGLAVAVVGELQVQHLAIALPEGDRTRVVLAERQERALSKHHGVANSAPTQQVSPRIEGDVLWDVDGEFPVEFLHTRWREGLGGAASLLEVQQPKGSGTPHDKLGGRLREGQEQSAGAVKPGSHLTGFRCEDGEGVRHCPGTLEDLRRVAQATAHQVSSEGFVHQSISGIAW